MLLELSDRGNLKYHSEPVLESIVIAWKMFLIIEANQNLSKVLTHVFDITSLLFSNILIYANYMAISAK